MKKCIISLILVMIMFLSVPMHAGGGGIGLSSGTDQKMQGPSLEEVESSRRIIAMAEEHSKLFFTRNYAVVEFWFCIYDLPEYKRYITIIVKALYIIADSECKNLTRVFFLSLDKSLVGHADKGVIIFSDDDTVRKVTDITTKYNEDSGKPYKVIWCGMWGFSTIDGDAITIPLHYSIIDKVFKRGTK